MKNALLLAALISFSIPSLAQGNKASQVLSKMEEAMGRLTTLSYSSQTRVLNSGRADSLQNYTARCWLRREVADTIFGAYLHVQQSTKLGRSDYYYDGINGIDIWHESTDKNLNRTIEIITPYDLPSGINEVQARVSLQPYVSQLIDSSIAGWKRLSDSMKVTENSSAWVLEWTVRKPRAGVTADYRVVVDKKLGLLREWHQFTAWNGTRFETSQVLSDIQVNERSDEAQVEDRRPTEFVSMVNTRAPAFSYASYSGKTISNGTHKLMLLDFWETWCGYCILAMPQMKLLHEKYSERGLGIVGVVTENREQVANMLKKQQTPYETIFADKLMLEKFRVVARPRYVLINEEGMIVAESEGSLEEMERVIEGLLK
jgi:thiol-disulfide isomerase/thioredoxin